MRLVSSSLRNEISTKLVDVGYNFLLGLPSKIKTYHQVRVEISSSDQAYRWIIFWLNRHVIKKASSFKLETSYHQDKLLEIYSPEGDYNFSFKGKNIKCFKSKDRQTDLFSGSQVKISLFESLTLSSEDGNLKLLQDFISEARNEYLKSLDSNNVVIWISSKYGEWQSISKRLPRSLSSVILADNLIDIIINDLHKFINSQQWYTDFGIPYKRGYMFHGPPGNGKTSLVFALASELKKHIAILSLNSRELTDSDLLGLLNSSPPNSIILLEDIDALFNGRETVGKDSKLTFSGLLNALDGVASSEGRIMAVTTNRKEIIDPALIRAGRIDMHVLIDSPEIDQIRKLFLKFYPKEEKLAQKLRQIKEGISMAKYQEHFIRYPDANEAINHIEELLNDE